MVENNIPDYMRGFDLNEDFGFTPVTSKPITETPSIDPKVIETNNVELSKIKSDVSTIKSMMNPTITNPALLLIWYLLISYIFF